MTQPGSYVIAANSDGLPNQDFIILGGGQSRLANQKSPGKATVKNIRRGQGWDIRKGYGQSGATVVPSGDPLVTFDVLIEVWAGVQYVAWLLFAAAYLTKAAVTIPGTTATRALSFYHPMVTNAPNFISEVTVAEGGVETLEEDADGKYAFLIHFQEYRAPMPALGKTAAALPTATAPQPTAQDAAIAALTSENATLRQQYAALAPKVPGTGT